MLLIIPWQVNRQPILKEQQPQREECMKMFRIVCAITAAAMGAVLMWCNTSTGPTNPPDKVPGNVLLSEGFETDSTPLQQFTYAPSWGIMSRVTGHAHTGKYSLTSDSGKTGTRKSFDLISDSIAGVQFYVMATKAEQINFFGAIGMSGSAWNDMSVIFGMGIGKFDSLQYYYQRQAGDSTNEQKSFAPLQFNKWYQCRIEYDFNTSILSYFLDGAVVKTITTSIMGFTRFVTFRDELGSPGPRGYYIDDISVYKR